MGLFSIVLLTATALCGLVAGFLFAFAVVAMPGIHSLGDREFIRAFQVMDRVIQDQQPVFMLVWIGSVVTLLLGLGLSFQQPDGVIRLLLVIAAALYLFGVQAPTATINIPLNNDIQTVDVAAVDEARHAEVRQRFEPRWNRWNSIRTAFATVTMLVLLVALTRLSWS